MPPFTRHPISTLFPIVNFEKSNSAKDIKRHRLTHAALASPPAPSANCKKLSKVIIYPWSLPRHVAPPQDAELHESGGADFRP
jgi:hypothetical protein